MTQPHLVIHQELTVLPSIAKDITTKVAAESIISNEESRRIYKKSPIQQVLDIAFENKLAQPIVLQGCLNTAVIRQELSDEPVITFDIGVDEVGRGPLYGNVVVAATILPALLSGEISADEDLLANTVLAGLTDSKKLTEAKRVRLQPLIQQMATGYVSAEIPPAVIDEINILQATLMGMRLACETLITNIMTHIRAVLQNPDELMPRIAFRLLIDGNKIPPLDWSYLSQFAIVAEDSVSNEGDACKTAKKSPQITGVVRAEAWVKGDSRHTAIAAASVLAKVLRDNQLVQAGKRYPEYGLEKHKGYPTKVHMLAIEKYGVLPEHRRSFKPIKQAVDNKGV